MERLLNQRGLYRKRARVIVKKAVSSKNTGHPKIVHNRSAEPLTWQQEEELMRIQEKKQREIDTFWGKDKDLHDRMIESKIMVVEDARSYKLARWRKQTVIFDAWDEVFRQKKLQEDRIKEGYREIERLEYIKYVNSSLTSDDIIDFVWDLNEQKADDNPRPKHADRWWRQSSSALLPPHQAAPSIQNEVSLSIPSTIGALRMSVHMDGMQQARVILNKANQSYKESLQLLQLDSATDDDGTDLLSVSSQPSQTLSFSSAKTDFMNRSIDSSDTYLNMPPPKPPRVPIVDGHLEHKWDQELMLNLAFIESDIGNKGYLTLDELLEAVGSDSVTELLGYTVFGSYLKLRHWWFLEDMYRNRSNLFVTIEADAESDTPEQTIFCDGVTYADWMKCAEKSAFESRVPLRHIRMQEEHMDIATAGLYPSILADDDDQMFTPPTTGAPGDDYTTVPEREHRCARFLEEGDCVWALHRGGSVWLPAVIKAINIGAQEINRDHDTTSYSKITYDLWYPLSQKELERSRALNTRRQLLVLPSHRLESYYPPKKVDTEREACAYAFELVDFQGRGLLQLSRLVTCLLSAEYHRVVLTSVALSIIFAHGCYADNARPNNGVRTVDIPPLLSVFIDTFSSTTTATTATIAPPPNSSASSSHGDTFSSHRSITSISSSISARDWISKSDFLDFCIAAVEVKKYTLTM